MRKIYARRQLYSTTVLLFLPLLAANPDCSKYGACIQYVPAPPGQVPSCAKSGSTYCEHVDRYPKQLIKYLIEKSGYDYSTLLNNEFPGDFSYRKPEAYGPRPYNPSRGQVYYRVPPTVIQPALSYGPLSYNTTYHTMQGGYPDRRYKIDPHLLTNALQQPPGFSPEGQFFNGERRGGGGRGVGVGGGYFYTTPTLPSTYQPNLQSIQWWKRYKRSKDSESREKRQTSPANVNQLCPTTSNFIMPKAALNTRGTWMYTVNLNDVDSRYTQLVRSETCISEQCNGLCSLPNGYTSRCEQKYVQKRLVALEGGGKNLYSDTFWFPHCCVCQITAN